jgi:DNA polymerase III sliding clamp (beta) subunit (PCNA family)
VTLTASELTAIEIKEPVKLSFSLHYLQKFARAAALSPFVKLHLHHEKPLELHYSLTQHTGKETGKSFLKFYLNST